MQNYTLHDSRILLLFLRRQQREGEGDHAGALLEEPPALAVLLHVGVRLVEEAVVFVEEADRQPGADQCIDDIG